MDEGDLRDIKIDRKQLAGICHRFRINLVVLFGSRAKGWSTPDSDYDIGVWVEDYPFGGDWKIDAAIWGALADLLGTDKVDLIVLNKANGFLSWEIAYYGVPIYQKDPFNFQRFQILALKRLEDMKRIDRWNRRYLNVE